MSAITAWRAACGGLLAAMAIGTQALAAPQGAPIRLGMVEGMSGAFANAGEAVERNLRLAVETVNGRGGVRLPDGRGGSVSHPLELAVFDSKGNVEEGLITFKALTDQRIGFVLQGNSSAVAGALIGAVERHNERNPEQRVLFLNYSAVDPALTNERCSFWHFRFDAHADMRMQALTEVIRLNDRVRKIYLIGQDYSFGQQVAQAARRALQAKRPDIEIVGDELHPIGKIKDFAPYISKIQRSGADAVITGNWGNDLTLLVKAAREGGLTVPFFTFYGNGLGAPAVMGDAGVGRVRAVAEWHPNVGGKASDAFYQNFRKRYPAARDDYVHLRMHMMVDMLAAAIEKAGTTDAAAVARAMEGARYRSAFHEATMRAEDHQVIQPLYVSVMQPRDGVQVRFDNEGSGFGFRSELRLNAEQTALATTCQMKRPAR